MYGGQGRKVSKNTHRTVARCFPEAAKVSCIADKRGYI